MNKQNDAYGQEVWANYKGERSSEIVERDDGYFSVSTMDYFSEYKDWSIHQKQAIKHAKGKILDIGCGVGRHAIYLQNKGLDVVGIDNSPLALKVARLRGLKKTKLMSIDQVGRFKANLFDTVLMLGNNFGLFGSYNKAKKLLKIFHKITTSNACIIAESSNIDKKSTNKEHLKYHQLNLKRGRMRGQIKMKVRFGKYCSNWFDYLLVTKKEMKNIVDGTGWKIEKNIDSNAFNYIAIIKKE